MAIKFVAWKTLWQAIITLYEQRGEYIKVQRRVATGCVNQPALAKLLVWGVAYGLADNIKLRRHNSVN